MTNLYFTFNELANPLTGSKVALTAFTSPMLYLVSGSYVAEAGYTVGQFSDSTGSVYFSGVTPGIWKVAYSNAGANVPATYQNFNNKIFYINVLDNSGSANYVDGFNFMINNGATGYTGSWAYTIDAANALFLLKTSTASWAYNAVSASYAPGSPSISSSYSLTSSYSVTASYAANSSGGGGGTTLTTGSTYNITSSWANNVISASYALSSSFALKSNNTISSSFAITASFPTNTNLVHTTGNETIGGAKTFSNTIEVGDLITADNGINIVMGSLTAQDANFAGDISSQNGTNWIITQPGGANFTLGVTANLTGTASWASNTVSSSYTSGSYGVIDNLQSSIITSSNGLAVGGMSAGNPVSSVILLGYGLNGATSNTSATIIGFQAASSSSNAGGSVVIGNNAGQKAVAANASTIVGQQAGQNATNAASAVIVGHNAGRFTTTSQNAVIIGDSAGPTLANAINSVLIGSAAGANAASASYSTFIGTNADALDTTPLNESIAIGYNAKVSGSNMCVIGGTGADAVKVSIGNNFAVNTLDVTGNISCSVITASLFYGTGSWANKAVSASYALTASYAASATATIPANISVTTLTGSYISASIGATVPTPINPTDAVNKSYVDNMSIFGLDYYFRTGSSDIVGYQAMYDINTPFSASSTLVINAVSASQVFLAFAAPAINQTVIQQGGLDINYRAYRSAGAVTNTIKPLLYVRSASVETLIGTGATVLLTTNTADAFETTVFLTSSYTTNLTDRLVTKFQCVEGTLTPNLTFTVEGQTAAGVTIPLPVANFVSKTGGTMTGNLTAPGFTGSLNGTASWAVSSSNAGVAAFANAGNFTNLTSGSTYNITSSNAVSASNAATAAFAITSTATTLTTASTYNITSSWSVSSSAATTAAFAITSTATTLSTASTYNITSSWSVSSSYAQTASIAGATVPFQSFLTVAAPNTASYFTCSFLNQFVTTSFISSGSYLFTSSNSPSATQFGNTLVYIQNTTTCSVSFPTNWTFFGANTQSVYTASLAVPKAFILSLNTYGGSVYNAAFTSKN